MKSDVTKARVLASGSATTAHFKSTESTWQKNIYTILKMEKFTQKIDTILDTESKLREVRWTEVRRVGGNSANQLLAGPCGERCLQFTVKWLRATLHGSH